MEDKKVVPLILHGPSMSTAPLLPLYLDRVSGFADFLTEKDHTLQEILNHLNRVVFMPLESNSVSLQQLNQANEIVFAGQSGLSAVDAKRFQVTLDMNDTIPESDALRFGKLILINTLPYWGNRYMLCEDFSLDAHSKSFLVWPVYVSGTPIALLNMISRVVLQPSDELESFLKTIGSVFSMYFYRNVLSSPDEMDEQYPKNISEHTDSNGNSLELSERQLVILRLISEERTNLSISQFLGYSESTIRQEIMKIFAKLGCSHRSEAAAIFKSYSQKS